MGKLKNYLGAIITLIAILTIISGAVQMLWPWLVLKMIGGSLDAGSQHSFGIIGMFMMIFGALTLHGLMTESSPALLWASIQKLGAFLAVALGVHNHVFSSLAMAVASFDLLSFFLMIVFWRKMVTGKLAS
jgi:hypothetical protein